MGYHRLPVTPSTQALRVELKKRIHELKYIDKEWMEVINKSGIDIVPEEDLQELSRERGMRALGLTRDRLERQYLDWVELSTDPKISVRIMLKRESETNGITFRTQCSLTHACCICPMPSRKWARLWKLRSRRRRPKNLPRRVEVTPRRHL